MLFGCYKVDQKCYVIYVTLTITQIFFGRCGQLLSCSISTSFRFSFGEMNTGHSCAFVRHFLLLCSVNFTNIVSLGWNTYLAWLAHR